MPKYDLDTFEAIAGAGEYCYNLQDLINLTGNLDCFYCLQTQKMKQSTVQVRYDSDQLDALRHFMGQKGLALEADLEEHVGKLFQKFVPKNLQDYLLNKSTGEG